MNELLNVEEKNELERCEIVIKQGLQTFVEVGQALMLIRDKRLYRIGFGTFENYCNEKWGLNKRYINRIVMASETVNNLGPMGPKPQTERQARPLTKIELELQNEVWSEVVNRHGENITAKKVEAVANEFVEINQELKMAKKEPLFGVSEKEILAKAREIRETQKKNVHVSHNSGQNEWYTPKQYIDSARKVLGEINLDPATSEIANKVVRANHIYTKQDNGINQKWFGNMWINPPYAQPLISEFANKIILEIDNFEQAIVLVNNATETKWYQILMQQAKMVCFPKSRIKFWNPDKTKGAPLQGQSLIYFGKNELKFLEEFKQYGTVLKVLL